MRSVGFAIGALLLSVPLLAHDPATQDPAHMVTVTLQRSAEAFERGDMQALQSIWANDDSVTVFENGHANYGWTDYRDNHLKPEIGEMKNVKYVLVDIKPHVEVNTAWATFKYTIEADSGGKHVDGAGLGTAILEKRGSDWKIVHWHSSAPRRKPADANSQSKQ